MAVKFVSPSHVHQSPEVLGLLRAHPEDSQRQNLFFDSSDRWVSHYYCDISVLGRLIDG